MRNILLTISYDGTDFNGWQKQKASVAKTQHIRTVQEEIENALEKLHKQPIKLYGSGRTDSGVHATAQAANFLSPIDNIPIEKYPMILNNLLPHDIRIMKSQEVPQDFNARFSATSRTYRYYIICKGFIPTACQMRYVYQIGFNPDIKRLCDTVSILKGEMDFASFASSGDASLSTFRYIEHAIFFTKNNLLIFEIEANAFLWKMVRTLVGTILQLEQKCYGKAELKTILNSHDRKVAGQTAPACGLFLYKVQFNGIRRYI